MPRKPIPQIKAWSYSRWQLYNQCPLKLKLSAIDKLPDKKSPAMLRGQIIHNLADEYVKGEIGRLPKQLQLFDEEFKELRRLYKAKDVDAEQMLCFDKDWNLVKDKWDLDNIWARVKTDATVLVNDGMIRVIDYKTGKVREEGYSEQLELYALACLLAYEDVREVQVQMWFLDHGEIRPEPTKSFYAGDETKLRASWKRRTRRMLADRRFDPTPNQYCYSCAYNKKSGGPCRF